MGNKHFKVKPSADILELYASISMQHIGMLLRLYKGKYSYQTCLLSREDFNSLSYDVFCGFTGVLFDHMTKKNPGVPFYSPLASHLGALEFFISCFMLCSPKTLSFDDKLDACMGLCQFRKFTIVSTVSISIMTLVVAIT